MTSLFSQQFLFETLCWTGGLIAAVLILRRPVTRHFGPHMAYALWVIPALRLVMPPIELPAWMRFSGSEAETSVPLTQPIAFDPIDPVATTSGTLGTEAAAPLNPEPITPWANMDFAIALDIALALWLVGAAIFLILRYWAYFRLRKELLGNAHEVGREGKVRLVESEDIDTPLAFGVIDKVIALPRDFLAHYDRKARDLALAHEMAHHRGNDLLINVLIQPLFALHWWNPLSHFGWLALRRDQEAACDARVLQSENDETREAYANLIVRFAAGPELTPNLALAAPMACPVLGEKSIIHRLRNLKMNKTTNKHHFGGRIAIGAALLALPLTATVSYAAVESAGGSDFASAFTQSAPKAPLAPQTSSAPLPPQAPDAPTPPLAPDAPQPPQAPLAPAPLVEQRIAMAQQNAHGQAFYAIREFLDEDGQRTRTVRRVEREIVHSGGELSEEEKEQIMLEVEAGLAEADRALENLPVIIEQAMEEAEGHNYPTRVTVECNGDSDEITSTRESDDGTQIVTICKTRIVAQALEGLREAREEIANDRELSQDIRDRVIEQLDRQIQRWERQQG